LGEVIEAATLEAVGQRIDSLWPRLNERQRRALLGAEAGELGWGGVSAVDRVAGVARSTVTTALAELDAPDVADPGLAAALELTR
jgi:hypothetical protein